MRSFAQTGWFLDIKGTNQDNNRKGALLKVLPNPLL